VKRSASHNIAPTRHGHVRARFVRRRIRRSMSSSSTGRCTTRRDATQRRRSPRRTARSRCRPKNGSSRFRIASRKTLGVVPANRAASASGSRSSSFGAADTTRARIAAMCGAIFPNRAVDRWGLVAVHVDVAVRGDVVRAGDRAPVAPGGIPVVLAVAIAARWPATDVACFDDPRDDREEPAMGRRADPRRAPQDRDPRLEAHDPAVHEDRAETGRRTAVANLHQESLDVGVRLRADVRCSVQTDLHPLLPRREEPPRRARLGHLPPDRRLVRSRRGTSRWTGHQRC